VKPARFGAGFGFSAAAKAVAIRGISTTPIEETHLMVKVDYRSTFEKRSGETLDLDTSPTYWVRAKMLHFHIMIAR